MTPLEEHLAAKRRWRSARARLPMPEKVRILEKLRERSRTFRALRQARRQGPSEPPA